MVFPAGKATEMMAAEGDHFQPDLSGDIRLLPCPALGDAGVCFRSLQKEVATGTVLFTFYPLDVNICFDNIDRGKTPLTIRDTPTDQHTLYAYKEGYIPYHSFFYVSYQGGYPSRHIQLETNQTA